MTVISFAHLLLSLALFGTRAAVADRSSQDLRGNTQGGKRSLGGKYNIHDSVDFSVNKVGPYNNPTETYYFYSLPFCQPKDLELQRHEFGESLAGDRKHNSVYDIKFLENIDNKDLCTLRLGKDQIMDFYRAVDFDYFYEMFVDGLPIWGFVGEYDKDNLFLEHTSSASHYVFTHFHFDIGHNKGHIVSVDVTLGPPPTFTTKAKAVSKEMDSLEIKFTYSVLWHTSETDPEDRMDRYRDDAFFPQKIEIHWLSIMNSFVLVLLLTLFLSVILMRVLKNDFTKYMGSADDLNLAAEDESGWKLIHGDVFRYPKYKMALASCVGIGTQLLVTGELVVAFALFEIFDPVQRGNVLTSLILSYCLTSGLGGYVSGRLYKQLEGSNWVRNTFLTSFLVPVPLMSIFMFLNMVAVQHESTAAVPVTTILILILLYSCVSFPLTVIGSIVGKNSTEKLKPPCRTNLAPRELPRKPWYRSIPISVIGAGVLPFSAVYIELHYIVASIWGHKMYTLFGILAVAMTMVLLVVVFVTIACVYYLLASEDYRWWWQSFMYGGSTGLFVFGYCFYYFFHRTNMGGFMQTSFFFGYMGAMAYTCTLALGALGFHSSYMFVDYIYSAIKTD
eukprot:g1847.t1